MGIRIDFSATRFVPRASVEMTDGSVFIPLGLNDKEKRGKACVTKFYKKQKGILSFRPNERSECAEKSRAGRIIIADYLSDRTVCYANNNVTPNPSARSFVADIFPRRDNYNKVDL